jgi:transcriptional antiterminator RfaH
MPILQAEPDCFPDNLFLGETDSTATREGRGWWVLHTRPRQEKSLVRDLSHRGIPFFLPLVHHRCRIRGRVLTSYIPLFTGYVFLLGRQDERIAALATGRVVRGLDVADQDSLWSDLRQVRQLLASGAPVTLEERLVPGMTVEINGGALSGLKGKIIRVASGRRFVVEVDFIQKGASVLLDDYLLARGE